MKMPNDGDKVKYVEKILQDDGVPPILQDVEAVVVDDLKRIGEAACSICHDTMENHDRTGRKHVYTAQEDTLHLDVSFSANGLDPATVHRREHVEYGTLANQWHK